MEPRQKRSSLHCFASSLSGKALWMVSLIREDIQRGRKREAGNTNTLVFNLCAPSLEYIESLLSYKVIYKTLNILLNDVFDLV